MLSCKPVCLLSFAVCVLTLLLGLCMVYVFFGEARWCVRSLLPCETPIKALQRVGMNEINMAQESRMYTRKPVEWRFFVWVTRIRLQQLVRHNACEVFFGHMGNCPLESNETGTSDDDSLVTNMVAYALHANQKSHLRAHWKQMLKSHKHTHTHRVREMATTVTGQTDGNYNAVKLCDISWLFRHRIEPIMLEEAYPINADDLIFLTWMIMVQMEQSQDVCFHHFLFQLMQTEWTTDVKEPLFIKNSDCEWVCVNFNHWFCLFQSFYIDFYCLWCCMMHRFHQPQ